MLVRELIAELQKLPQELPVRVYESDPDDYINVSKVDFCEKDVEPHVRICSPMDDI